MFDYMDVGVRRGCCSASTKGSFGNTTLPKPSCPGAMALVSFAVTKVTRASGDAPNQDRDVIP